MHPWVTGCFICVNGFEWCYLVRLQGFVNMWWVRKLTSQQQGSLRNETWLQAAQLLILRPTRDARRHVAVLTSWGRWLWWHHAEVKHRLVEFSLKKIYVLLPAKGWSNMRAARSAFSRNRPILGMPSFDPDSCFQTEEPKSSWLGRNGPMCELFARVPTGVWDHPSPQIDQPSSPVELWHPFDRW